MSYPLAVIIPTYNRCDALSKCMQHLEEQTRKDFEVVIIDDGSTDSTEAWVSEYLKRTPLSLRYFRQKNSGQARARNFAVSVIESPITLLIGDDIFPAPQFTATHMQLHEQRPEPSVTGLGLTVWAENGQHITPFMRWLDTQGVQFDYANLLAGTKPGWQHFYTSNLSMKTSLLRANPFNETFKRYGMEDIELGCRLDHQGELDIVFLPDALACHLHPMSFSQACRRMEKVGEAAAYFDELWPGKMQHRRNSLAVRVRNVLKRFPKAMPVIESIADQSLRIACPNRLMTFVLYYYLDQGYDQYQSRKPNRQSPIPVE